ncbi:hypothetical protein NRA71_18380, partial [Acinetobacter baumannii]|nr:hypothetical protein [Acinetobacter baumannii]
INKAIKDADEQRKNKQWWKIF